ncbi:DUF805 domain-containing protein [Catenulispora pinisilvae]|uniref:DUF805 domain-containing protein n=1 Tax=Catenulispora pinisilvae TaxID=2705253 RepID=UPI0018916850|nr:DUF805 domain-containing protein [Catenulispora pinisilvae]
MNYYLDVLRNYAGFSGRARRAEYWMYVLTSCIIGVALIVIGVVIGFPLLWAIYGLAVTIPGLAVVVRRLHDTDRPAGWIVVVLVPIIGAIILLVLLAQEGTHGPNRYGPDPKESAATSTLSRV